MARMVKCIKLGRDAEGLDFPPYPGELGKRIYENVSKEAWQAWIKHQTMLINENKLNLADPRARKYLAEQMEKHICCTAGEQSVGNDAGDVVDRRFQLDRVEDGQAPNVENDIAIVGGKTFAQLGLAAELHHLARNIGTRHRDHFDRQRKFSEHRHQLRFVCDANEPFRHRGDDFLARERSAPALSHGEMLGDLVGPVDVDRQLVDAIEVEQP